MAVATVASEKLPYGSWPSPITARFITSSSVRLGGLNVDTKGQLYWLEGRPQEGGRQVVCKYDKDAPGSNERGGVDVTPKDDNVRTRVHEYGGGAHTMHPAGGIIYSDFKTQRLFWAKDDGSVVALTPEDGDAGWPAGRYRFADGKVDPSGKRLVTVREDHGEKGDAAPVAVVNEVVSVALDGSGAMTVLATGRDFYAAPRVSPSGGHVAYVSWDHPSMPWDATELRVACLDGDGATASASTASHILVDGADADTSVLQPDWHPLTGALYYISDSSGFYNLWRVPPPPEGAAAAGTYPHEAKACILPRAIDFGGAAPGWQFGQQGYTFLNDGRVAATYPDRAVDLFDGYSDKEQFRTAVKTAGLEFTTDAEIDAAFDQLDVNKDGRISAAELNSEMRKLRPPSTGTTELLVFNEDTSGAADVAAAVALSATTYNGAADGLPHSFGGLAEAPDGTIYFLGGGPDSPAGVYAWKGLTGGPATPAELLFSSSNSEVPTSRWPSIALHSPL